MKATFLASCVGQTLPVLFETQDGEFFTGHSDTYVLVRARGEKLRGRTLNVLITGTDGGVLTGELTGADA